METQNKEEKIGAITGGTIGAAGTVGVTAATFAGMSAAGVTGTLGAIGGSLVGGVLVVAAAPIVAGGALALAGWGIAKGIKKSKQKQSK